MTQNKRAVRIRHYQGERLKSRDLQDEQLNLEWLRGLHVVALHDTWGIALGFNARLRVDANGRRSVLVTPGFAYDYQGREIVLTAPQQVFAPAASGAVVLVMRYDESLNANPDPFALCPTGRERPAFVWRRPDKVRLGLEIPLLGISDKGEADTSVRRYAQPNVRPHIGSGITPLEQVWTQWTLPAATNLRQIGFRTWVDTSKAGFVQTPHYLAYMLFPAAASGNAFGGLAQASTLLLCSTSSPRPTGFYFQFAVARGQQPVELLALARAAVSPRLQISWIGIEPVVGCAPFYSYARLAQVFRLPELIGFQR